MRHLLTISTKLLPKTVLVCIGKKCIHTMASMARFVTETTQERYWSGPPQTLKTTYLFWGLYGNPK